MYCLLSFSKCGLITSTSPKIASSALYQKGLDLPLINLAKSARRQDGRTD